MRYRRNQGVLKIAGLEEFKPANCVKMSEQLNLPRYIFLSSDQGAG